MFDDPFDDFPRSFKRFWVFAGIFNVLLMLALIAGVLFLVKWIFAL